MTRVTRAAYTEESAEVEVLLANVDKLKGLTKRIQGSLQRLDTSGKNVQDAIRPIHGDNSKLQITSRSPHLLGDSPASSADWWCVDIDRINEAIERIQQPLDKRRREEAIIRPGLQRTGLDEYISSMDRTYQALNDLKHSNLRSNQQAIDEFSELLRVGSTEIAREFKETLATESAALEPLHYLTKKLPFPSMSAEFVSKLRLIDSFAETTKAAGTNPRARTNRTGSIYAEVRGPYIRQTLQNLAQASITTVKKTDPKAIYRKGTSAIGMYCLCIEGMFLAEYENMRQIFTPEQWSTLPTRFCQEALTEFGKTLKELHNHINRFIDTDSYLAYEIVEVVSNLAFRLDARGLDIKPQLEEHLRPIFETARKTIRLLLDITRTRIQSLNTLPADAAPDSLTTDIITRLQTLTDYQIPVTAILGALGESGWRAAISSTATTTVSNNETPAHAVLVPSKPDLSTRPLLAAYVGDVLEASLSPLDTKSRTLLKTKSAQGAFLLNTVALTDRGIASAPDLAMLITEPTRKTIDTLRKRGLNLYLDAWRDPCLFLQDVVYTNRTTSGAASDAHSSHPGHTPDSAAIVKGLSNKEKDAIKDKFRKFNESFEELVQRHKGLRLEREVRATLAREVTAMIEPLYARFWDRYWEIDRGRGKYVRFDKGMLGGVLAGLAGS